MSLGEIGVSAVSVWQIALGATGLAVAAAQHAVLLRVPAKTSLPAWKAKPAQVAAFAGVAVFCLFAVAFVCATLARRFFPETDFRNHALLLVPATQTLSLAALLCAMKLLPDAFPSELNAPPQTRSRDWLSIRNRFGVPAFFAVGFFAVAAAGILLGAAAAFLPEHVREIFQANQRLVNELRDPNSRFAAALAVPAIVVFTPILEELIFRGALYRLFRSGMNAVPAALCSSVIFALMHDAPATYLPLTLLGCVLCFAYEKTGRIAAPILVHALFNANTLLCVFLG